MFLQSMTPHDTFFLHFPSLISNFNFYFILLPTTPGETPQLSTRLWSYCPSLHNTFLNPLLASRTITRPYSTCVTLNFPTHTQTPSTSVPEDKSCRPYTLRRFPSMSGHFYRKLVIHNLRTTPHPLSFPVLVYIFSHTPRI